MNKQQEHYRIPSVNGTHYLAVTEWNQVPQPKGVVQIVHGMREHILRYHDFALYLNQQGYIVVGYDHLGHGRTVNSPDDYGYFGDHDGAKLLVQDCTNSSRYFKEKYPELPLFVLGHSMGSFITRLSVLHTAPILAGYVCMGTAGPQKAFSFTRVYVEALSLARGTESHTDLTDRLMEKYSLRRLGNTTSPDAWISRDPATVKAYEEDPKTRFSFTNQGYADLLDLQMACNLDRWFEDFPKTLPILFASGEEDPIGNFGKDIPLLAQRLEDENVEDCSYLLYPQARHEILNEFHREQVYRDLAYWFSRHLF